MEGAGDGEYTQSLGSSRNARRLAIGRAQKAIELAQDLLHGIQQGEAEADEVHGLAAEDTQETGGA